MEIEILKTAMEFELNGARFYLETARKVKDVSGKNILIRLALDELDHHNLLSLELDEIQNGKKWKKVKVKESVVEKIKPKLPKRIKEQKGNYVLAEVEALEIALEQEKKSMDYYKENARKINDPAAKDLLMRLAQMEEAHYTLIQTEIDNIRGYGFWMGFQEFDME
jgi:rubrerythrin